jgi:hypothetical protein
MSKENALELLIKSAEAAIAYDRAIQGCANDPDKMSSYCTAQGDDLDTLYFNWIQAARSALIAAKVSPAAANKATEEGELPLWHHNEHSKEMHPDPCGEWVRADTARFAIERAIAADRASRQVANKAEIDLSSLEKFTAKEISERPMFPGIRFVKLAHVEELLATPPATTGASTAHYEMEFTAELDRLLSAWSDAAENGVTSHELIREKIVAHVKSSKPVGASTVLTDERIDALWEEAFRHESFKRGFARAIEREVEAQAGQNCFLSWGGKNVHGDEASIKAVKAALHDAGTVPELKDRIRDLQAQAGQVAVPENMALVPKEPNLAMVLAGEDAWEDQLLARVSVPVEERKPYPSEENLELCSRIAYRAMIAAASSPAKESK